MFNHCLFYDFLLLYVYSPEIHVNELKGQLFLLSQYNYAEENHLIRLLWNL